MKRTTGNSIRGAGNSGVSDANTKDTYEVYVCICTVVLPLCRYTKKILSMSPAVGRWKHGPTYLA
jgi:hypothetical protein